MPRIFEKRFSVPQAAEAANVPESTLIADLHAGRVRTSGLEDSLGRRRTVYMTQAQVDGYRGVVEKRSQARAAEHKAIADREQRQADTANFQKVAEQADQILRRQGLRIEGRLVPR